MSEVACLWSNWG